MEIVIKVSDQEKLACLEAIKTLNDMAHVRQMSQATLAQTSGIKTTKMRAVIAEVCKTGLAQCLQATDNPKLQRYYYVITEAGRSFMAEAAGENK